MDKELCYALNDKIVLVSDTLKASMWALHKRLSEAYDNPHEQLQDASNLGKHADAVKKLSEARSLIQDLRDSA